jgi:predicted dehydrogenase
MYGLGTHSLDQTLLLFGRPKSVTGFQRVLRMENAPNAADDSFTIILQYGGEYESMLVTVKTTIVSPNSKQLKYWVRGTEGSFVKVCCPCFPPR